jgi:glycosyltransferase involved in cell wall biosynthesis
MSTYALNFCRAMIARDNDLTVISQYRPDSHGNSVYGDAPPLQIPGAEIIGAPQVNEARDGDFESDIADLVRLAVSRHSHPGFDVIHAQYGYPPGAAALLVGQIVKRPVIISLQGGDGHWFGTCCKHHAQTMRWTLESASTVIFPTESFRQRVVNRCGMIGRHAVVPGAVDTSVFKHDDVGRRAWRKRLALEEATIAAVYHGRLDNRKGVSELIRAFATLPAEVASRTHLVIAGVGPDADELRELAVKSIAAERLSWMGLIAYEQIPGLLSAGDLHCSPTYQEGFSNTLVEAAAVGLPLLTTDTVGVRDTFTHMSTAWLVPIQDVDALREGLIALVQNKDMRTALAISARAFVTSNFSWTAVAARIEQIYRSAQVVEIAPPPTDNGSESCRYRKNPVLL